MPDRERAISGRPARMWTETIFALPVAGRKSAGARVAEVEGVLGAQACTWSERALVKT